MYSIDESIPFMSNIFLAQSFLLIGSLTIIALTLPLFLCLIPPLGYLYYKLQQYYRATSRELRRLDSVSRSPIYTNFSETLSGRTGNCRSKQEETWGEETVREVYVSA